MHVAHPVRDEPHAAAEVEDRSAEPARAAVRVVVLVAGAVHPQVVARGEPLRVRDEHRAHHEGTQPELVRVHDGTDTADAASRVALAELRGDDQDVTGLLLHELSEHALRALGLAEPVGTEVALGVVVERARRLEDGEHALHGLVVRRRDLLPARDGEPPLGAVRQASLHHFLGVLVHLVGGELREVLQELGDLLGDRTQLVLLRIPVLGRDFLVRELVADGELLEGVHDRSANRSLEVVAALDDELGTILVEGHETHGVLDGILSETGDLFDLSGGRRHDRRGRRHCLFSLFKARNSLAKDASRIHETSN